MRSSTLSSAILCISVLANKKNIVKFKQSQSPKGNVQTRNSTKNISMLPSNLKTLCNVKGIINIIKRSHRGLNGLINDTGLKKEKKNNITYRDLLAGWSLEIVGEQMRNWNLSIQTSLFPSPPPRTGQWNPWCPATTLRCARFSLPFSSPVGDGGL